MLRRKKELCQKAWKAYIEESRVPAPKRTPANYSAKTSLFRRTKSLYLKVRDWLHERNLRKERTVAKDLLAYLESEHILPPVQDSPQGRASSIRAVQRYIKAIGWRRGRRSRKGLLKESPSVLLQRDQYIQFMIENVTARRVVYLDESYIHHHYKNTDD